MSTIHLLRNQTADGSGNISKSIGKEKRTVFCTGTFGGGTVSLEVSEDGVTWLADPDLVFTADSVVNMYINENIYMRGTLAGSLGADVSLKLV